MMPEVYIVLDNVKYAKNLGPIFRLADGLGIKKSFSVQILTVGTEPSSDKYFKQVLERPNQPCGLGIFRFLP